MRRALPVLLALVALVAGALVLWLVRAPSGVVDGAGETGAPEVALRAKRRFVPLPIGKPAGVDGGPLSPTGTRVLSLPWGSGEGALGREAASESNPEMPMAIVALADGGIAILDQVNGRLSRFRDGRPAGSVKLSATTQDVAISGDGKVASLDRLVDRVARVHDRDGKLLAEVPLAGEGVPEPGHLTGVFVDGQGVYVEREHGALVRVADPGGKGDGKRSELPGRPTRDGRSLVHAEIADAEQGIVVVDAFDRASLRPTWRTEVRLPPAVLHLLLLDSDARGNVYVGGAVGRESPTPPYAISDEKLAVARLAPGGAASGLLLLPPLTTEDECLRPITVADDGGIFVMVAGEGGLIVMRYEFP